jgi:hypothetical protein
MRVILKWGNTQRRVDDFSSRPGYDMTWMRTLDPFKVETGRTMQVGGVGSLRVQGAKIVAFVSSSIDDEIIVLDE